MQKVQNRKLNKLSKYYLEFIQLLVVGLLFLFVLNKELVLFVKEFISALPIGASLVESIALKGYIIFNILSNSPSLFVLTLVLLQVMIFAHAIKMWVIIFCNPFSYIKEDVIINNHKIERYCRDNTSKYLETSRLRF